MPSQLLNLSRRLTWTDFGTPVQKTPAGPGQTGTAALTRTGYRFTIHTEFVPRSSTPRYRLKDDVRIEIHLQRPPSWVASWVFQRPVQEQNQILHHEQGHYDLVALLVRDMFIEIMQLNLQEFVTPQAVLQAVDQVRRQFDPKIQPVQDRYDHDTDHGLDSQQQARWDGFIQQAFTQLRNPPEWAPDGAPYKMPLLDLLQQAGIQI